MTAVNRNTLESPLQHRNGKVLTLTPLPTPPADMDDETHAQCEAQQAAVVKNAKSKDVPVPILRKCISLAFLSLFLVLGLYRPTREVASGNFATCVRAVLNNYVIPKDHCAWQNVSGNMLYIGDLPLGKLDLSDGAHLTVLAPDDVSRMGLVTVADEARVTVADMEHIRQGSSSTYDVALLCFATMQDRNLDGDEFVKDVYRLLKPGGELRFADAAPGSLWGSLLNVQASWGQIVERLELDWSVESHRSWGVVFGTATKSQTIPKKGWFGLDRMWPGA
ncbi:hypothetical protein BC832DRAFT_602864 [Gaertneriomyces semiglobifer]|nr:hypothetical protein BC832DRAFT_602864 [Gaertneriomyces semiglobifer]